MGMKRRAVATGRQSNTDLFTVIGLEGPLQVEPPGIGPTQNQHHDSCTVAARIIRLSHTIIDAAAVRRM